MACGTGIEHCVLVGPTLTVTIVLTILALVGAILFILPEWRNRCLQVCFKKPNNLIIIDLNRKDEGDESPWYKCPSQRARVIAALLMITVVVGVTVLVGCSLPIQGDHHISQNSPSNPKHLNFSINCLPNAR